MARIHKRTIQKDLHDPENYNGVIIHLELDILECEVKWVLRKTLKGLQLKLHQFIITSRNLPNGKSFSVKLSLKFLFLPKISKYIGFFLLPQCEENIHSTGTDGRPSVGQM